jgi:flagellar biosynthesis regulator FlaF
MGPRWIPAPACLLAALLVSGCESPPNKEMDQAQGAIDAALATGADKYATTEYSAATDALKNANDAVAARDYRLALNYALESHEHAQNAARDAADAKARTRVEVDRAVAELATLVAQGRTRLAAAERARVPRRLLTQPAADLAAAEAALQKTGETSAADDYLAARATLEGVRQRVEAALAAINDTMPARPPQPRR